MTRSIGVCFVFNDFHPTFSGHAVYMQQLMRRLPESWRLTVIARDSEHLPRTDKIGHIQIYRLPRAASGRRHTMNLARMLYCLRDSYQCVHFNGFCDYFEMLLVLLKLLRRRVVVQTTLMGSDDAYTYCRSNRCGRYRLRFTLKVDALTCISRPLLKSYRDCGFPTKRLSLIPQGVDVHTYRPLRGELRTVMRQKCGLHPNDFVVICVGTIMYRKGIDILIRAWRDVQQAVPRAHLLLVGMHRFGSEHASRETLQAFADEQRSFVQAHALKVRFVGLVSDVQSWYQMSDVFVLASRKEGFGNVILEAMACGLPCVVTPMDGVAYDSVVPGVTGHIVDDANGLADAIIELSKDSGNVAAMGGKGLTRASEIFDLDKIADQYKELYTAR